jgi:integrase
MANRSGTWDGGYIHKDARRREVYVIRQQVNGKRYEVSTRTFSVRAALDQLKRFQADPENYDPRGEERPDPIHLDEKLAREYLVYSRNEKENSRGWVTEQRALLAWWAERLKGVDLRCASVRDSILPALEGVPGKPHKVAVLKAVYTWLRKVRREISLDEDPTAAGGLTIPVPKRQSRPTKAIPREHVELAREHLVGIWRDALDLQAETGWHVTEVQRFTTGGSIEPPAPSQREMGVAGVLVVEHKSGEQHRTAVSTKTLNAAQRLHDRGGFSIAWYHRAVKAASRAAGIRPFGPGRMRHSVATWAVDAGADIATVSTFLGHMSARTTKKFYATHATPRNPMLAALPAVTRRRRTSRAKMNVSGHK